MDKTGIHRSRLAGDVREAAARKLRDRGIEPTEQRLTAFAAHAARNGKPLDDVIEAVLDATLGEPERLKGLGIKQAANRVAFTYRGRTVESAQHSGAIVDALAKLTGSS